MADPYPPSEFGGKQMDNGVQPRPHEPTRSEALMLGYTTGDETGVAARDNGEAFQGLLPERVVRETREREGAFKKGEAWEEMTR